MKHKRISMNLSKSTGVRDWLFVIACRKRRKRQEGTYRHSLVLLLAASTYVCSGQLGSVAVCHSGAILSQCIRYVSLVGRVFIQRRCNEETPHIGNSSMYVIYNLLAWKKTLIGTMITATTEGSGWRLQSKRWRRHPSSKAQQRGASHPQQR